MSQQDHSHSRAQNSGRYFVAGLITIIPLGVTVMVLTFLVNLLTRFGKLPATWLSELLQERLVDRSSWAARILQNDVFINIFSVIIVIVLVYFLGVMTSNILGRWLLSLFERIMHRIPVVKSIYGAVKKLMNLMSQDTGGEVQRVVLIEFPSPEMKTVGLVTRTFEDCDTGLKLAAVYVPTTPNPTSGYLEIVPVDRIVSTDWSFDEAMQFIVSGGAVAPANINYEQSVGSLKGINAAVKPAEKTQGEPTS